MLYRTSSICDDAVHVCVCIYTVKSTVIEAPEQKVLQMWDSLLVKAHQKHSQYSN